MVRIIVMQLSDVIHSFMNIILSDKYYAMVIVNRTYRKRSLKSPRSFKRAPTLHPLCTHSTASTVHPLYSISCQMIQVPCQSAHAKGYKCWPVSTNYPLLSMWDTHTHTRACTHRMLCCLFQAVIKCSVYKLNCVNNSPGCVIQYSGEKDCIFQLSRETSVGDEIAHDFADDVLRGRTTFKGFCERLSRQYRTYNACAAPFVSPETFIRWFFAWLCASRIDFRQEIDYSCGHGPTVLAADGTHFGTSTRHLKLDKLHILEPDLDETVERNHTRHTRSFLPYAGKRCDKKVLAARNHLRWKCKNIVQDLAVLVPFKGLTGPTDKEKRADSKLYKLLDECPLQVVLFKLFATIHETGYPVILRRELAKCLLNLVNENAAPLVAFFPWRHLGSLQRAFRDIANGYSIDEHLQTVSLYSPWFSKLLDIAIACGEQSEICLWLLDLTQTVLDIHSEDRITTSVEEIPNSYDPSSGVAYYFTASGNQVRKLPNYKVGDESTGKTMCSKKYPTVSKGGYAYMQFIFCPRHGHCYGFHVMPESEGRRDVFYPLLKYLPTPPKLLFYDFGCSLLEYGLNREPHYFRSMQCAHDIFHEVGHTCSSCYKLAGSLPNLSLNTEICEQFNAFIKKVRYTSTHLTFNHFCLFTQYCVYKWNKNKTEWHRDLIRRQQQFCGLA